MKNNILERNFYCMRGDVVIRGREFYPGGEHLPVAIASHGFGGNQGDMVQYCRALAAWGYVSYCFDFSGGCIQGESSGRTEDMTIWTECEDLKAVMDYAGSLPYTDMSQLILLGCSQGGFVSALTAASQPERISRLILFYPALCIPDDARRGALAGSSYCTDNVPDIIDCGQMKIGRKFHEAVVNMDVFEEIKPYKGRVLLIHGTSDEIVDYNYSVKAKETYQENNCRLELIEGAGHGFDEEQTEYALDIIHCFLQ